MVRRIVQVATRDVLLLTDLVLQLCRLLSRDAGRRGIKKAIFALTLMIATGVATQASASSDNLRHYNDAAKKIAKQAIEAEFAGGHPICNPEIDSVSITSKSQLNASVIYDCEGLENAHGRRRSGVYVSASLRGVSIKHPNALGNAEDFNVNKGEPWSQGKWGRIRWTDWHNTDTLKLRANHSREDGQKPTQMDRYRVNIQGELNQTHTDLFADGATVYRNVGGATMEGPILLQILVRVDIWGDNLNSSTLNSDVLVLNIARRFLEGLDAIDNQPEVEVVDVGVLDANPLFSNDRQTFAADRKPSRLINETAERKGTTADGVSQLILRVEVSEPSPVEFRLESSNDGTIEPLKNGKTLTLQDRHFAFALYTPPEFFDRQDPGAKSPLDPPDKRLGDFLEVRDIEVLLTPEGGTPVKKVVLLARPPVVLVHGLFSDPIQTWVSTFPDEASMAALLERAGFLPFMVNYQDTNGSEKRGSWFTDDTAKDTSSFYDNRSVVWDSPLINYTPVKYEYGEYQTELQKPQGSRIGGIKQALTYYRENLDLAAAQATVIGHSMGGLLARVWASEGYNDDYKRPENFNQGDIDRLLTLNTPHHGSELMELKDALGEAVISDESWTAWARRRLANTVVWWFLYPEPGAVTDLRPGSEALRRIGKTEVPSYAIATKAAGAEMASTETDPFSQYNALYSAAGTAFFNNRPLLDDFVLARFKDWESAEGKFRKDHDWRGQTAFDLEKEEDLQTYRNIITQNIDRNIYYWEAQRDADFKEDLVKTLKNTVIAKHGLFSPGMGNDSELDLLSAQVLLSKALTNADVARFFDDTKTSDVPDTFLTILRDLVFHQDPETDGAVRVVSQIGDLPDNRHEIIENVVHSYSPWDYDVQRRVLFLIKWGDEEFEQGGFEDAGQLTPRYMPSAELSVARVTGEKAIEWSGMVPSHAEQYLKVADDKNVVILARPVNRSSTQLLIENAAAKGMNVKGKSANWGPQIGYIPFKQRYSKLWRIVKDSTRRQDEIDKYNNETAESTTSVHPDKAPKTYAVKRALSKTTTEGECAVVTDPKAADAEDGVLFHCGEKFYDWRNATRNDQPAFDASVGLDEIVVDEERRARLLENPMMVLADGTSGLETPPYLTADYDLLAIGFPFEQAQCGLGGSVVDGAYPDCQPAPTVGVRNAEFDTLRGYISPRQAGLLDLLNGAVDENTPYTGGLVTHHGPETQYPKSPYIDYPILVFDPAGDNPAVAFLIRQGPPGFRDIHLKRLFTEKNRLGYNLWPNPKSKAWRWEERRPFDMVRGYDPRDAANLPPYVEEAPEPVDPAIAPPAPGQMAQPVSSEKQSEPVTEDASESSGKAPDAERKLWTVMRNQGDPTALKIYLRAFPDGHYADEAKRLLLTAQEQTAKADSQNPARQTTRCDELAAFGWDPENDTGVAVNEWQLPGQAENAIAACRLAVHQFPGDLQSKYQLARALIAGKQDTDEAIALLTGLAALRYTAAMTALADEYLSGRNVTTDEQQGKRLFQLAAERGDKIAEASVAAFYLEGIGGPQDVDKAIALLLEQSANDNAFSDFFLGLAYSEKRYGRLDLLLAVEYLEIAAEQGVGPAAMYLGELYERGEGMEPQLSKAIRAYEMAAKMGSEDGAKRAERLHKIVARQSLEGDDAAEHEKSPGTEPEGEYVSKLPASVIRCDSAAADKHDPRNLSGKGVSDVTLAYLDYQYLADAVEACRAAVADFDGDFASEYQLARLLLLLTKPDEESEGVLIMKRLAESGFPAAMTAMGNRKSSWDENLPEAADWYLKAAKLGDLRAKAEIAKLVLIEKQTSVDREEVIGHLNESLEANFWGAFLVQSTLHYTGVLYPINDKEAAIASFKAIRFGGERRAALHIRYQVELWNTDYRRFLQELLHDEGLFDGPLDGADIQGTVDAVNKMAERYQDKPSVESAPEVKTAAPAEGGETVPDDGGENAESVWAVIQNNNSIAVLEAFIRKFPDSFYAELATARVEELKAGR